ncbi:peptidase inhibitor I78 family protein [Erwinia tracheiphila]|uniref:Peptidase inhibitor I78 family protein n=1 Tax=Erwinia tracheiphila TaxID=65700 RepID=A0A0M2KEQ3_9GAMM|nr:peptidase inhibitor I78 family protein [Erwinia tracheiphila]
MAALLFMLSGCRSDHHKNPAHIDPEMDRCGASEYQHYVGQPLSAIDRMKFSHPTRAIPYRSAVTMDFNLNRLNFLADSHDSIIRVYCG